VHSFKIHLPKHQIHSGNPSAPGFYGKLYRFLDEQGADVSFHRRYTVEDASQFEAGTFHFVHQGLVRSPNVLNTGLSYFRHFWYADPIGVFGESSIARAKFDPETINPRWARGFFGRMQRWYSGPRKSKHAQPQEKCEFGRGHVAVFLQGPSLPVRRVQNMEEIEMVEALLAGIPEAHILVKCHPRNEDLFTRVQLQALARCHPRLKLVEANVHDMLRGARLSCSISSSVSMEGFLYRVPAMLFGRTDFHHCAVTVEDASDVAYAYDAALGNDWPFEAFLYWFLRENCLDERDKNWLTQLLSRVGSMR